MGTIDTLLKVRADASQAVRGLAPLQTSLEETATDAKATEKALAELGGTHTISVNDQAIAAARAEVERLRNLMREQLRLDPTADTRDAQKKIRELQRAVRTLDAQDATVDIAVNADATGLLALRGALTGLSEGFVQGGGGGLIGRLGTSQAAVTALGGAGTAAAVGVGALAVGGGLAAKAMWDLGQAAADVQTQVVQLDALTDGLGVETFEQLNEFASQTPFMLDEVTLSTRRLVAAGVDLQTIPGYLDDIGNLAAATGVPLERIATIFGQMESKGRLTFEETQQLAEAGIPVWQTLADKLGMTVAEVQKLATEGKLGAEAVDLLRVAMGEQFPTAMADQAETFNGQMSTLKDTMHTLSAELGTLFLPMMTELVGEMQELADGTGKVVGFLTDLDDNIKDVSRDEAGLIDVLGAVPGMTGFVNRLGDSHEDAADKTADHKVEADRLARSILEERLAAEGAEKAIQDHADLMDRLAENVESTADHYRDLVDNFETFRGSVIDARSNVFDYEEAVDSLAESLADSSTFAPDAEAGRANWDNLVAFAEIASERVEDTWKTKGKGAATALQASFRQSLHQMLIDAGVNSEQAWSLVDQVMKKPHQINIEIGAIDDARLRKQLARLRRERAEIQTEFVLPKGAGGFEAQLLLDEQSRKLKPINAKIQATLEKLKPEKDKLEDAANPNGKPRKAKIEAKVDPASILTAKSDLATLTATETKTIKVHFEENPTGDPITPRTIPTLLGPMPTLTVPLHMTGGGSTGSSTSGGVTRLAPKTTPVAVYLDGVEIAHRIEARRALAASESVRRSA